MLAMSTYTRFARTSTCDVVVIVNVPRAKRAEKEGQRRGRGKPVSVLGIAAAQHGR